MLDFFTFSLIPLGGFPSLRWWGFWIPGMWWSTFPLMRIWLRPGLGNLILLTAPCLGYFVGRLILILDMNPLSLLFGFGFPTFPCHFWLLHTLGTFGRFLRADDRTPALAHPMFARVCVEMDVSQPLPSRVWVGPSKEEWILPVAKRISND